MQIGGSLLNFSSEIDVTTSQVICDYGVAGWSQPSCPIYGSILNAQLQYFWWSYSAAFPNLVFQWFSPSWDMWIDFAVGDLAVESSTIPFTRVTSYCAPDPNLDCWGLSRGYDTASAGSIQITSSDPPSVATREPATLLLLGCGLALLGGVLLSRRCKGES